MAGNDRGEAPEALAPTEFATAELIQTEVAPGPGQRTSRGFAQAGGAGIVLQLWRAFDWFHSQNWNDEQWIAVTAASVAIVGAAHNTWNWWSTRRR